MEAGATEEANEVALEEAAAELERLRTAEGAVSWAWLLKLPRAHVWLLGTWMGCAHGGAASGGRTCGGIVENRRQVDQKPPGLVPGP